jgi:rhodanese-related sulfurtransferase
MKISLNGVFVHLHLYIIYYFCLIDNSNQLYYNGTSSRKEGKCMDFNIIDWIIPIVLGLAIGLFFASRKQYDYSKIITLKKEEFAQSMRKGQLIDIRSESDYKQKKISGSKNFPKRSIFASLQILRKDQAIFIVDQHLSPISRSVAKKLVRKGFGPIYLLDGGLDQWTYSLKE